MEMKPFKIAYLGGTFSLLHNGHIDLMKRASQMAERVVVSLNTDEFVERFKGKKPVDSYEEREEMVKAIKYVDEVIKNIGEEDSKIMIDKVKPDLLVEGGDWLEKDILKQWSMTTEWMRERNISLIFFPRRISVSTTDIKERIKHG